MDEFFDNDQEECDYCTSDVQLKFIIKNKTFYCSKIVFMLQSNYYFNQIVGDQFDVSADYHLATVESVRLFIKWIKSSKKTLDKIISKNDNHGLKLCLILAKLADIYKVPKLSAQISEKLAKWDKSKRKIIQKVDQNFQYSSIDKKSKNDIIKNYELFLYKENQAGSQNLSPYLSILRSYKYEDKKDILEKAIAAGQKPSLLSSIFIFDNDESKKLSKELPSFFQLSNTGFSLYLASCTKDNENDNDDKSKISEEENDGIVDRDTSNDLKNLRNELDALNYESEELFDRTINTMNQYNSIETEYNDFKDKLGKIKEESEQQADKIKEIWSSDNQADFDKVIKNNSELDVVIKNVNDRNTLYSNLMELLTKDNLQNYISSRMLSHNLSHQYVNDSLSLNNENISAINISFESDLPNPIICDIKDDFIFIPLYYELGFCYPPSKYSWKIFADFHFSNDLFNYIIEKNDDNKSNNNNSVNYNNDDEKNDDNESNNNNSANNINNEKNDDNESNNNNSVNNNDDDEKNDDNESNNNNSVNNNDEKNNDNESNNNNSFYNIHKENDDNESNKDWTLIISHDPDENLEGPDESYDPCWDDPFKLKFKFFPGFCPRSIKFQLDNAKDLNIQNQDSLNCFFNHFQIVGILSGIKSSKTKSKQ